MKTYTEILKAIKVKNPTISHRDAQSKASETYKKQTEVIEKEAAAKKAAAKKAGAKKAGGNAATKAAASQPKTEKESSLDADNIEKIIRDEGVNVHSIQRVGRIYGLTMYIAGKDGVNTQVYLDGPARVPKSGYFLIWI